MIELIEQLFGQYGILIVFVGGLLESLVITGIFIPGSVLLLVGGYYASIGLVSPFELLIMGIAGMYVGDILNYCLGRIFRGRILSQKSRKILNLHINTFQKASRKYGTGLIGYGHVLGSVRSFICFGAGAFGYPFYHFLLVTFLSTVAWASIFVVTGVLLGSASIAAHDIIQKIQFIAIILAILAFGLWLVHKKVQAQFKFN